MKTYSFNFRKTIKQLMPYFLVKPVHYAWLQTLNAPIGNLYANFLSYRQQQLYNATINSQVNRLTKALQDEFNDDTIEIVHPNDFLSQAFIYLQVEGSTPEFDYLISENHQPPTYDNLEAEYNAQYDFVVRIPQYLLNKTTEVYAFVKKYAFSSLRYTIETF